MAHKDKEFHLYVMDLFADIPGVTSRPMFGGYGIYKNGVIFAIIADGQLYFKADGQTDKDFQQHGSRPFTYKMPNGKELTMSYWLLPDAVMEDRDALPSWVDKAVDASRRDQGKKRKPSKKRKGGSTG